MSMFDPGLTEYTAIIDNPLDGSAYRTEVYALGGGTPGRFCSMQTWAVRVTAVGGWQDGSVVLESAEFYHGMPATHSDIAVMVLDYIESEA